MDEYIKKNQALCCFSGWVDQNGDFHEPDEMIEYQRIEQLTASDVVPVVRCIDCKHSPLKTWFECPLAHLEFDGDRWCWKGEREDGDGNG